MFPSLQSDRSLPHIDEIRFDLSGVNTYNIDNSGVWVNDSGSTLTILSSHDYNAENIYKTKNFPKTSLANSTNSDIENILSKITPIDIRVYGIVNNNEINYPDINTRALIFNNLQFLEASPPSTPFVQTNTESISTNEISVNYQVNQTENGVVDSNARINTIRVKYTELDGNNTLVSSTITQDLTEKTKDITLNLLNAGDALPIELDSLRFGTKYTYKVSVKNNFSSTFSTESASQITGNFTALPSPGSASVNLSIHNDSLRNILKPSNSSQLSNIIYVNTHETTGLKFSSNNIQTFEVTDINATTTSTNGIGKGVDDENDIVTLEILKNSNGGTYSSLQIIKYSGFDTTTNIIKSINNTDNANSALISNITTNDKYSSNALSQGFRINGNFKLNNLSVNNVTSLIGTPSVNPYNLQIKYTRTYNSNDSIDNTKEVYIDNLNVDPTITKTSESFNITSVLYTMGIPSVKTFSSTFNRTYNNINSEFGFIPGNGKIGEITSIAGTNKSSSISIIITNTDIDLTNKNYQKSTSISGIFYNSGTVISKDQTFIVKEKVFSLLRPNGLPSDGGSNTITTKHFCDRNSYNLSSNQIYSRKFNTTFSFTINV